ncbi:BPI fold-containing family C -like isoform X1 [Pelobates cultripes]|uniref:Bactericidal permeability-increasing protein n=1 Tax=Pelobates cultripes TaxID=61616 RepID=A0AAD1SIV8_PELCU|nr:BPI fold-containing family C -like isoform X1 [Pelobates cultripes]
METATRRLNDILLAKTSYAMQRLKVRQYSQGNRAGRAMAALLQKKQAQSKIPYLISNEGTKIYNPKDINDELANFYHNLYNLKQDSNTHQPQETEIEHFLDLTHLPPLTRELDTFQVISQLDAKNEIDYSLVHPPRVEKTHIDLELKGSVHPIGSSRNDLFPEIHINLPNERTSMVYIGLSEYFFNSIGKNYFTMNTLKLVLTHEQFPRAFWLRTGDYGTIIPKIEHHYPQSQAMKLELTATKAPMVTVTPQNITMEMTGLLQGMVVLPYLVTNQVFSVNMVATLIADKVQLSGLNLVVSFVVERYKFHEFKSSVGYINVAELESALDHSLRESVLREINDGLQKGIPMPALGNISLQDPAVTITQGCVLVSVDMFYTPWTELMRMLPHKQYSHMT